GFFPAGAIGGGSRAPESGLGIQIVEVSEFARGKEVLAYKLDCSFDASLLVAPTHRHGTRLVAMMRGEREQRRVEADRITLTFEHGAFKIVVQDDLWQPGPCREGTRVARQEAVHAGIEEEAQIDLPRPRQHHHEGHQRPARATDLQMAEVRPVDLALFTGQGAQAQIGLRYGPWTVQRDQMPEVMRVAPVAALIDHRVQATGRKRRKLLQRLMDERQVSIDLRGSQHGTDSGQTGLGQHALDGAAVDMQLAREGAGAPLLDVVVTQDLRFEFGSKG